MEHTVVLFSVKLKIARHAPNQIVEGIETHAGKLTFHDSRSAIGLKTLS